MTPRHLIRTPTDFRTLMVPIMALMLVASACVVVIAGILFLKISVEALLAVTGLLISNAVSLMVDPGRHGRVTDPDPPTAIL